MKRWNNRKGLLPNPFAIITKHIFEKLVRWYSIYLKHNLYCDNLSETTHDMTLAVIKCITVHCTCVDNQSFNSLFFCRKKKLWQVCVKHETGGRESDQLPDRLVSWTSRSSIIIIYCNLHHHTKDIHSFHIDRHLPAECPAKPLSFFFSDTLFGSSEEMGVIDVETWGVGCKYYMVRIMSL